MESNTVVWIVVAIVAVVVVIAAQAVLVRRRSNTRRHLAAERIREEVNDQAAKVDKRAALAEETAAKARAAEAAAQAKAAEAARLKEHASSHHEAVASSREDIEEKRRQATPRPVATMTKTRRPRRAPIAKVSLRRNITSGVRWH
jgi:biopolymer transport protein ExbB/TolQ